MNKKRHIIDAEESGFFTSITVIKISFVMYFVLTITTSLFSLFESTLIISHVGIILSFICLFLIVFPVGLGGQLIIGYRYNKNEIPWDFIPKWAKLLCLSIIIYTVIIHFTVDDSLTDDRTRIAISEMKMGDVLKTSSYFLSFITGFLSLMLGNLRFALKKFYDEKNDRLAGTK